MPALAMISRLRHFAAGSPPLPAESSSCSCGPPIRLRLLPTPPHSDAVSFGYGVLAFPDKDFHPDVQTPPRAYYEARCARRPGGCAPRRAAEVAPTGHRLPRRSRAMIVALGSGLPLAPTTFAGVPGGCTGAAGIIRACHIGHACPPRWSRQPAWCATTSSARLEADPVRPPGALAQDEERRQRYRRAGPEEGKAPAVSRTPCWPADRPLRSGC